MFSQDCCCVSLTRGSSEERQGCGEDIPGQTTACGNESRAGWTPRAPSFVLFYSCKTQLTCRELTPHLLSYCPSFRTSQPSVFWTVYRSPFLAHLSHMPGENPTEVSPTSEKNKYPSESYLQWSKFKQKDCQRLKGKPNQKRAPAGDEPATIKREEGSVVFDPLDVFFPEKLCKPGYCVQLV